MPKTVHENYRTATGKAALARGASCPLGSDADRRRWSRLRPTFAILGRRSSVILGRDDRPAFQRAYMMSLSCFVSRSASFAQSCAAMVRLGRRVCLNGRRHLTVILIGISSLVTDPNRSIAAEFQVVTAPFGEPTIGILLEGEILHGDDALFAQSVNSARARFREFRLRAIALNSPGGEVAETLLLADRIRSLAGC